jgi:uncharacterized damage-inducible protein DinB
MAIADLRTLFAYDRWANARLFEVMADLSAEQLAAPVASSYPSILQTFAHLVAADWVWLRRWQGENPTGFPDWIANPSLGQLRERLAEVESEREALLASPVAGDPERLIDYRTFSGTPYRNRLADLCLHVVNHSSYHRGQLVTMFRQVGATPVSTDFVVFKRDTG